jgi:hypothetical protein
VDTVIACTPCPTTRHPVRAIAPTLSKCQKSTINVSPESDHLQALLLSKACGNHNVLQQTAGGDHNVPQHQKAIFGAVKWFKEAIEFTKTSWPIISDEKYSLVDEAWKVAIEAQDCQWALAGATGGIPSVCQLLGGPSLKIHPPAPVAIRVHSVFFSSIPLIMTLHPEQFRVKTND